MCQVCLIISQLSNAKEKEIATANLSKSKLSKEREGRMMLDLWHPVMTPRLRRVEVRQLITTTVTPKSMLRVPCSNEACQETVRKLTEVCSALRSEVYQLREKVSKLSFSQETFKDNDDMVQDLTGLPSFAKLMVVFTFVSEFLKVGPGLSPFQSF